MRLNTRGEVKNGFDVASFCMYDELFNLSMVSEGREWPVWGRHDNKGLLGEVGAPCVVVGEREGG